MTQSGIYRLVDGHLHYYCEADRCGSNFFMYSITTGWVCNACITPPLIRATAEFAPIPHEPQAEVNYGEQEA